MLSHAQQSSAAATATPWHTDWLTSSEMGFPLVADGFHRARTRWYTNIAHE